MGKAGVIAVITSERKHMLMLLCAVFCGGISALFFPGCQSSQDTRGLLSHEEQKAVEQYEAELEVGRNMAGRLIQHFRSSSDTSQLSYLNTVGQLIVENSPFADRRFVFGILDTEVINAFAAPGGYVLVTRGALAQVESEAELAAILGHEIAHVGKLHVYDTMLKRMKAEHDADAEKDDKSPDAVKVRRRPRVEASETASTLAKYIGGASGGQFNILSAISTGLGVLLEEGLDPQLEFEADAEGLKYALAAGYEPSAMVSYFKRILKKKEESSMKVLGRTHPSVDERIDRAARLLAELEADQIKGALGKARYQKRMLGKRGDLARRSAQHGEASGESEDE